MKKHIKEKAIIDYPIPTRGKKTLVFLLLLLARFVYSLTPLGLKLDQWYKLAHPLYELSFQMQLKELTLLADLLYLLSGLKTHLLV